MSIERSDSDIAKIVANQLDESLNNGIGDKIRRHVRDGVKDGFKEHMFAIGIKTETQADVEEARKDNEFLRNTRKKIGKWVDKFELVMVGLFALLLWNAFGEGIVSMFKSAVGG